MTEKKNNKSLRWPLGIAIVYGAFVLFLMAYLAFAQMQRVDLVTENYYEKEIKYQQQIDRLERTRKLPAQPEIFLNTAGAALILHFPAALSPATVSGQITLLRPSDASLDFKFPLKFDERGEIVIDANKLRKGLWKALVEWKQDGQEYYFEEVIIIP